MGFALWSIHLYVGNLHRTMQNNGSRMVMGSGPRFEISFNKDIFGLGITISRFPHALSISLVFTWMSIYMGFGKGYDE